MWLPFLFFLAVCSSYVFLLFFEIPFHTNKSALQVCINRRLHAKGKPQNVGVLKPKRLLVTLGSYHCIFVEIYFGWPALVSIHDVLHTTWSPSCRRINHCLSKKTVWKFFLEASQGHSMSFERYQIETQTLYEMYPLLSLSAKPNMVLTSSSDTYSGKFCIIVLNCSKVRNSLLMLYNAATWLGG